jgi:hypothetical protein
MSSLKIVKMLFFASTAGRNWNFDVLNAVEVCQQRHFFVINVAIN